MDEFIKPVAIGVVATVLTAGLIAMLQWLWEKGRRAKDMHAKIDQSDERIYK
jgi:hypothetical protein